MFWSIYIKLFVVFWSILDQQIQIGGQTLNSIPSHGQSNMWDNSSSNRLVTSDEWGKSSFRLDTILPPESMNESQARDILREYCPKQYCGFNNSVGIISGAAQEDTVCCQLCYCNDNCHEIGNCCYDKVKSGEQQMDEKREFCTSTSIVNNIRFPPQLRVSYLLYQHCNNTSDVGMVEYCNNPGDDGITERLPVYSPRTGRHYRNRQCAICNDDQEDLTYWNQEVRCRNPQDLWFLFDDATNTNEGIIDTLMADRMTECTLYFTPPKGTTATKCLHPQHMFADCDVVSPYYWLQEKCTAYHSHVRSRTMIFKNVFCMMCNERLEPFEPQDCLSDAFDVGFQTMPVAVVLSVDETIAHVFSDVNTYGQKHYNCTQPAIFNEDLNTCLMIKCPLTTLDRGGQCYAPFTSISNVNLDFRVLVKYIVFEQYDPDAIFDEVLTLFAHLSNASVCKLVVKSFYVAEDDVTVDVQMVFHASNPVNLKDTFNDFVNSIRQYNAKTSSTYKMEVGKVALMTKYDRANLLSFDDEELETSCKSIAMSEMMFCPMVILSETSFTILSDYSVDVAGVIFTIHEYVRFETSAHSTFLFSSYSARIGICLHTYLSKYQTVDGGLINGGKHISALWKMIGISPLALILSRF